jgi:predicted secreted hydrolase
MADRESSLQHEPPYVDSLESEVARLTRSLAAYREVVEAARKVAPRRVAMHRDYRSAEWWKVPGADLEALAAALASLPPTGTEK